MSSLALEPLPTEEVHPMVTMLKHHIDWTMQPNTSFDYHRYQMKASPRVQKRTGTRPQF